MCVEMLLFSKIMFLKALVCNARRSFLSCKAYDILYRGILGDRLTIPCSSCNSKSSHLRRRVNNWDYMWYRSLLYRIGVPAGWELFKTESHSDETIPNRSNDTKLVFPVNMKNFKIQSKHFFVNCKQMPCLC